MALFTDGGPASISDIKRYDSSAEELARDAGIDLDAKLAAGAEEIGQDIFEFLLFRSSPQGAVANLLLSLPPGQASRQRLGLSDVVVTASLIRWHALQSLIGLYRDAYGSDVTDRYRLKWEQYEILAREAAEYAFTTGIGLSRNPVPKAPVANIAQIDATASRSDYVVRVTWTNSTGVEGAPSDVWQTALGTGDKITIPGSAPTGVFGWNVYVGPVDGEPLLQNDSPLAIRAGWTKLDGDLMQGRPAKESQLPDYLVVDRRTLLRG